MDRTEGNREQECHSEGVSPQDGGGACMFVAGRIPSVLAELRSECSSLNLASDYTAGSGVLLASAYPEMHPSAIVGQLRSGLATLRSDCFALNLASDYTAGSGVLLASACPEMHPSAIGGQPSFGLAEPRSDLCVVNIGSGFEDDSGIAIGSAHSGVHAGSIYLTSMHGLIETDYLNLTRPIDRLLDFGRTRESERHLAALGSSIRDSLLLPAELAATLPGADALVTLAKELLITLETQEANRHPALPSWAHARDARAMCHRLMEVNELCRKARRELVFKLTNRFVEGTNVLPWVVASDRSRFGEFISWMSQVIHEGSGRGARLKLYLSDDELEPLMLVNRLRTWAHHDVEHGEKRKVTRDTRSIALAFESLIGKSHPETQDDFFRAQSELVIRTVRMLECLKSRVAGPVH